jgi:predicted N-formylglutamate amidohydrolase
MKKIFHIPHSSVDIPEEYINEFIISKEQLEHDAILLCDFRTNEMVDDGIIFPYSRLFCDVERYNSDLEKMNDIGMGVLYMKNHNLDTIRENPSIEIINYYNEHHRKLNEITKTLLETNSEIFFIDLHSYSKEILPYELNKDLTRPEICIGINERYNKELLKKLIYIIEDFGYTYFINEPFIGCLLPSDYIDDERVHGIMIEIRKDVYDSDEKFEKIKELLKCVKEI